MTDQLAPIAYLKERWDHQAEGEERAVETWWKDSRQGELALGARELRSGYAYLFQPGTGKTFTAINTIRRLGKLWSCFPRTLILAPPVVLSNWKAEFKKFSQIPPDRIHILHGEGKKRLKKFQSYAFDPTGKPLPAIFITNYESLTGQRGSALEELFHAILRWQPQILVNDESQYLKDLKSIRTKNVERIANPIDPKLRLYPPSPFVLNLSGTPAPNTLMDVFSQWLVLDGGQTFGRNFFEFRNKYFYDEKRNVKWDDQSRRFARWVLKPGSEQRIRAKMGERSMSALKSECLSLPPLVRQTLEFDMSPTQTKHYNEMRRQLITYIDSDACVAKLAITKALRLMQIASGFIRTEDGYDHPFEDDPKRAALKELLYSTTQYHKVIVWAVFKQNYLTIKEVCDELGLVPQVLHGGMTDKTRNAAIREFNEGKARVLIGHPRAGGIGCNLTASSYAYNYSATFSASDREQAMARNHRGGSEIHESITWVDLVMNGTIEKEILKRLDDKEEVSLTMLRALTT